MSGRDASSSSLSPFHTLLLVITIIFGFSSAAYWQFSSGIGAGKSEASITLIITTVLSAFSIYSLVGHSRTTSSKTKPRAGAARVFALIDRAVSSVVLIADWIKSLLLILYMNEGVSAQVAKIIAYLMIALMASTVVYITLRAINAFQRMDDATTTSSLILTYEQKPAISLSVIFSIFLLLIHAIAFGFAFQDRSRERPALICTNPPSDSGLYHSIALTEATEGATSTSRARPRPFRWTMLFDSSGSNDLKCTAALLQNPGLIKHLEPHAETFNPDQVDRWEPQTEIPERDALEYLEQISTSPPSDCTSSGDSDINDAAIWNVITLLHFREKISKLSNHEIVRVVILGHATEEDPEPALCTSYSSNFELSMARAQRVQLLLLDEFFESRLYHETEWIVAAASEADYSLNHQRVASDNKRSVEIRIDTQEKAPGLCLFDYIYFTVYTITTTGYGDLIPVTAGAKLLCSVTNILEIIFLVVFISVIVGRWSNRSKGDGESSGPQTDQQGSGAGS